MKILLVAATPLETEILRNDLQMKEIRKDLFSFDSGRAQIHLLHTGIGMINTAFFLGDYLATNQPDLAINFGIAGSFDRQFALGDVVEIVIDHFSELGAESPEGFLGLEKMGFPLINIDGQEIYNRLENPNPSTYHLPKVKAITVNKVHGLAHSIEQVKNDWQPQVETMESAAFFHAMQIRQIPCHVFRSLSNYVEVRNKSNWKIGLAVKNVQNFVFRNTLKGWI